MKRWKSITAMNSVSFEQTSWEVTRSNASNAKLAHLRKTGARLLLLLRPWLVPFITDCQLATGILISPRPMSLSLFLGRIQESCSTAHIFRPVRHSWGVSKVLRRGPLFKRWDEIGNW